VNLRARISPARGARRWASSYAPEPAEQPGQAEEVRDIMIDPAAIQMLAHVAQSVRPGADRAALR
jgi:hypothetical protein